ncbi:MAG: hypothetical protein IT428_01170 [Planctomycetaceae bacterium]|nr:hypothetical protein [Planctomycetaceae bacterium]
MTRALLLFSPAILVAVLLGCGGSNPGPPRAVVSGKVTLDDQPIEEGSIAFIPMGGTQGPTSGAEIKNGEYKTPPDLGPVYGLHRVEITAYRKGKSKDVEGVKGATGGPSAGGATTSVDMYIPEKYNRKSELTLEVVAGENKGDYPLKSK